MPSSRHGAGKGGCVCHKNLPMPRASQGVPTGHGTPQEAVPAAQPCPAPSHSSVLALAWGRLQGLGATGSIMWQPRLGRIQLKRDVPNRNVQQHQPPRDGRVWPHRQSQAWGYSDVHQPPFQCWGKQGRPCLRRLQALSLLLRPLSSSHPNSISPARVELNIFVSSWARGPVQMMEVGSSQGGPTGPGTARPRWGRKWGA